MMKPPEVYACLYAQEFPAQALQRLRPELRDKPCVVMDGEPPLQAVCSLTRKARSLGMSYGMTQVEVDTFSGITVLQRSLQEEIAAREIVLECAGCLSPRVEETLTLAPKGTPIWKTPWFNFAPRLGIAWTAQSQPSMLGHCLS